MKLSLAIRLGAMLRPQAHIHQTITSSCALEAAADAIGYGNQEYGWLNIRTVWTFLREQSLLCPCPCEEWQCKQFERPKDRQLYELVYHLNDFHHWTRERIADWVESIEPAEPPVVVEEVQVEEVQA